ncbi:hypothetical protein PO909_023761 [Leuciscus waleckii]
MRTSRRKHLRSWIGAAILLEPKVKADWPTHKQSYFRPRDETLDLAGEGRERLKPVFNPSARSICERLDSSCRSASAEAGREPQAESPSSKSDRREHSIPNCLTTMLISSPLEG